MSLKSMTEEEFNATYPIGSLMTLTDDFGDKHEAVTTSKAWTLGHGDVIVHTDIKRSYGLERLSPRPNKKGDL